MRERNNQSQVWWQQVQLACLSAHDIMHTYCNTSVKQPPASLPQPQLASACLPMPKHHTNT